MTLDGNDMPLKRQKKHISVYHIKMCKTKCNDFFFSTAHYQLNNEMNPVIFADM